MVQVKGVLDKEEVLFAKNKGYLYATHVVVGLPDCLAEASKEPHAVAIMQHTLAVAVDEVDACFLVSQPTSISEIGYAAPMTSLCGMTGYTHICIYIQIYM